MRPPLVYLGSILLGLLLHFAWPLPLVRQPVGALIGAGVIIMAVGLFISAVRAFRAAGTAVPGNLTALEHGEAAARRLRSIARTPDDNGVRSRHSRHIGVAS